MSNARTGSPVTLPAVALVALFAAGCLLRMDEPSHATGAPHPAGETLAVAATPALPTALPTPTGGSTGRDVLAWVTDAGARTTFRIAATDTAAEHAIQLPGVQLGAGAEVWSYAEERQTATLPGCEGIGGAMLGAGDEATLLRAVVTRVGDGAKGARDVIVDAMSVEGLGGAGQTIELMGTIGPTSS